MEIVINGKQAVLKKNTSFEFISENSMFTGSDSYTLTISFPLKDCPQNIEIFGHIHRQDVEKAKIVFDCDIRDKSFFKSGSITITEISEVEVKTQFLEGRSEQNFDDTFDDIYINQMQLGYPSDRNPANYPVEQSLLPYPTNNWVPLPWVNNSSGNLQNEVTFTPDNNGGSYAWTKPSWHLTFQPYLLYILNKICECIGYTGDFSAIENSQYKYLLICNTLPRTWGAYNFCIALPHWSLTEFFEQLEYFLYGEFIINHKAKTIVFRFTTEIIRNTAVVAINKVVNEYTTEVSREDSCDYLGVKNLMYADNDNRFWILRSCQWYINANKNDAIVYNTLSELISYASTLQRCGVRNWTEDHHGNIGYGVSYTRGYENASDGNKLFYAKDVDTYFIMLCYKAVLMASWDDFGNKFYEYFNRLEPINQFGKIIADKDADDIEMKIVPAWIDETDDEHGHTLFLEPGEMDDAESWEEYTDGSTGQTTYSGGGHGGFGGHGNFGNLSSKSATPSSFTEDYDVDYYNEGGLVQSKAGRAIAKGEVDKSDAYYDCLYVAFWDGNIFWRGKQPCPIVDKVITNNDFEYYISNYSLRLSQPTATIDRSTIHRIDGKKKHNFSFLSDVIPDARAIFYIKGGRYLCEKLTVSFSEHGRSEMIKGTFYRLLD